MTEAARCDLNCRTIVTPQKHENVASQSTIIIDALRAEPHRKFVIRDIVEITHSNEAAVRKTLSRLASDGKGSGAVRRVAQGLYQYDPTKENGTLQGLLKFGFWRVENITFVRKGAQGGSESQSPELLNLVDCDTQSQAQQLDGFPWRLPTGQKVMWGRYTNGTEEIHLSAKGAPPFSPDHALTIIHFLEKQGFGGAGWYCTSIEANVDSRNLRVDSSFSLEIIKGLLIKVYQHSSSSLRVELAERRQCSMREVMSFLHAFTDGFDGAEALHEIRDVKKQIRSIASDTKVALSNSRKALCKSKGAS